MIQIRFAIITAAVVLWAMGSVAAQAFEQTPVDPAPPVPVAVPAPQPNLSFSDETTQAGTPQAEPKKKGRSLKLPIVGKISVPRLPGVGKLSFFKLDFGLDLIYGSPGPADAGLGFSGAASEDGLTILGKVKRRF